MSADKLPPGVLDRLRKIQKLAESGVDGERENAQRLLLAICDEHGISPDALLSTEQTRHRFSYIDARDRELLVQCCCHVLRRSELHTTRSRKGLALYCTEAEAIDVVACHRHYRRAYLKAEAEFYLAFISKNDIFSGIPSDEEAKPMDPEKLARLLAMMRGLNKEAWRKSVALTA